MEGGSIIIGVVFILISVPFFIWRIPPNWCYGVRCAKTLSPENEEIWYKVNKFAARTLFICGVIMLISVGIILTFEASLLPVFYWTISIATFLFPFVALVIIIAYLIKA